MVDNATASKAKWVLNEVLSLNAQEYLGYSVLRLDRVSSMKS